MFTIKKTGNVSVPWFLTSRYVGLHAAVIKVIIGYNDPLDMGFYYY